MERVENLYRTRDGQIRPQSAVAADLTLATGSLEQVGLVSLRKRFGSWRPVSMITPDGKVRTLNRGEYRRR